MDSMEEIYKTHAKTVYGFLLTRTRDSDTAQELTQETRSEEHTSELQSQR